MILKRYISVFTLYINCSFYKMLGVIALMTSAQVIIFSNKLNSFFDTGEFMYSPEIVINVSKIHIIFAVGFIIATALLLFTGCEFNDKQGYTLRRLRISEKEAFICQALYNIFAYVILFVFELIAVLICFIVYIKKVSPTEFAPELINNMTVFLGFYRSDFLHALLPLDDIIKHFANIAAIIGMGFTAALFPYFTRRGRLSLEMFILVAFVLINFLGDFDYNISYDLFIIGPTLLMMGIGLFRLSQEVQAYEK